jgi:hypothetical protein
MRSSLDTGKIQGLADTIAARKYERATSLTTSLHHSLRIACTTTLIQDWMKLCALPLHLYVEIGMD